MYRNVYVLCLLVLTLGALDSCSSGPSATNDSRKAAVAPDKIQGTAKVAEWEASPADAAMNAGGPSVYLVNGLKRYRLFFNKPAPVENGKEYVAEGIYAQKAIDEIGDPDKGRNGYPLPGSCDRVVRMAWPGLAFDVTDGRISVLQARIKRYPARPIFLVERLTPVGVDKPKQNAEPEDEEGAEVSAPAEKQRALLLASPPPATAPLWEPTASTTTCRVIVNKEGNISKLDTGAQLCEAVDWSQFRYKPTLKTGHPVAVRPKLKCASNRASSLHRLFPQFVDERPETKVTERSGDMGNTFCLDARQDKTCHGGNVLLWKRECAS